MLEVFADGIKDFSLSQDGKSAMFSLTTNYTSDIVVTIPAECLNALQSAVQLTAPAPSPGGQMPAVAKVDAEKATDNPIVNVPKEWFAAADTKHGFVVVILDRRTPEQFGFALGPAAAKELAAGLIKQADAVAASKATKRN